jgi:hypothetical protein
MDDSRSRWGYLFISPHLSHNIVTALLLFFSDAVELRILDCRVFLELRDCVVGNGETQFFFGLDEPELKFSPCAPTLLFQFLFIS